MSTAVAFLSQPGVLVLDCLGGRRGGLSLSVDKITHVPLYIYIHLITLWTKKLHLSRLIASIMNTDCLRD